MGRLYDLHQGRDQRWQWFGATPGRDELIVSRRSWDTRWEAANALTSYLALIARTKHPLV
jgi:hypothetical protein